MILFILFVIVFCTNPAIIANFIFIKIYWVNKPLAHGLPCGKRVRWSSWGETPNGLSATVRLTDSNNVSRESQSAISVQCFSDIHLQNLAETFSATWLTGQPLRVKRPQQHDREVFPHRD
jgi:hypothetical protein